MFNVKLAATLMVALMMFSGAAVMVGTEDNDAAEDVLEALSPGSWTWDRTTGYGPFNMFYGAFDIDNSNSLYAILDPYDLSKTVAGADLPTSGHYNIMLVIPTVYWLVDANGNLELSNDSTKGTAYAHTIDGHVYNYIAIGVYEATSDDNSNPTKLTSESGKLPLNNKTRTQFRTLAQANTMDSSLGTNAYPMLWNFYQWELYKYISLTMIEDFNSQTMVGYGHVYTSSAQYQHQTGALDAYGPYAGEIGTWLSSGERGQNSVKMLIENAWGGVSEFVDGFISVSSNIYVNTSHNPNDSSTSGTYISALGSIGESTGFPTEIYTDALTWGWGINSSGSNVTGLADTTQTATGSTVRVLSVGGAAYTGTSPLTYGINSANAGNTATDMFASIGTRLAFVFDDGPASVPTTSYDYLLEYDSSKMATGTDALSVQGMTPVAHRDVATVTVTPNDSDYGTVSPASITDIEPGDTITIANNTITYGETVVTATPAEADAQYTYAFSGFVDSNSDPVTGTVTVNSDMTITAVFTATTNQYAVTISPNDPSYGSISPSSLTVDYGTAITVSGTSLTIGSQAITPTPADATAQYTFAFDSWTVPGAVETVTGPITITGTFTATVNEYTVTIESADVTLGTVDVSEVQDVPYGTAITVDGDTVTIGETVITATVIGDGLVTKWSVSDGDTVKGDMTITASFVEPSSIENTLMGMLPLLLIIVLVITAAGGVFASGGDPESLIKLIICLAVGVIVISVFVLPIAGGL